MRLFEFCVLLELVLRALLLHLSLRTALGQNMTLTISLQLGFDLSCVGLAQDDILETKESKGVA